MIDINKEIHSLPSHARTYVFLPKSSSQANEQILQKTTIDSTLKKCEYFNGPIFIKNAPTSDRICVFAFSPLICGKLLKRIDQELSKSVIQCIISRYLWKYTPKDEENEENESKITFEKKKKMKIKTKSNQ